MLLTGGSSTRMGSDKARLQPEGGTETLAQRTGRMLCEVAAPCVEVGPGHSGLPAVAESPPGQGPLAAVARGWELLARSAPGAVLVVATDLPALTTGTLRWLACYGAPGSVVPLVDGRPQPLCARWASVDLDRAVVLVAEGRRALRDLLAAATPLLVDPCVAEGPGDGPFADADTPAAARHLGVRLP
jgi:molybdopterin-guanine dinucleotide biosynthesis protein A